MKAALSFTCFLLIAAGFFSLVPKVVFAKPTSCPPECSTAICLPGGSGCDPTYGGGYCYQGIGGHRTACPRQKTYCPPDGQNYYVFNPQTKQCDATIETPTFTCIGGSCDTALGAIPVDSPSSFLTFVLKLALFASGAIVVLMIISTGYTVITSGGNPEALQGAQENIIALFSGLALIAFSLVLLQAIGAGILGLSGF